MKPNSHGSDLTYLVQRTLEDLSTIRQKLLAVSDQAVSDQIVSEQAVSDQAVSEQIMDGAPAAAVLDLEMAGQLKNAVDAMRLLLWAYIKALSGKSSRSPHELLSSYKTDLALEMLRSTRPLLADDAFGASDLERLINWAMVSVSRYPDSPEKSRNQ